MTAKKAKPKLTAIEIHRNALTRIAAELPTESLTVEQRDEVVRLTSVAKAIAKACESAMKAATADHKAAIKVIESAWKPVINAADEIIARGKRLIQDHVEREERRRAEENARREAELAKAAAAYEKAKTEKARAKAEAQVMAIAQPLAEVPTTMVSDAGAVSVRLGRWTYEVVNLGEVPAELLAVDHAKVIAEIAAGKREIPGLRIFQPRTVVVGDLKVREELTR